MIQRILVAVVTLSLLVGTAYAASNGGVFRERSTGANGVTVRRLYDADTRTHCYTASAWSNTGIPTVAIMLIRLTPTNEAARET